MKTFKRIYIEITNTCNLACSFCPPTKRKQEFMSVEDFEQVLMKLQGHGQYVYLHIKGEPTLHPFFINILKLCHQYGFKVNLTTNGTLLSGMADEIFETMALRQVSLSLQSQEDLEDSDGYINYMKEILSFVKLGLSKSETIFELRLWNYDGLSDQKMTGKNHLAIEMIKEALQVTQETIDGIPKGKGVKLQKQVYLSKAAEFQWPDMALEVINKEGTCYGLRQQVGILVSGDVVACCLDSEGDITLGNIFEADFEAIVMSQRGRAIVQGFEQGKIIEPLCQRCGYRSRFS